MKHRHKIGVFDSGVGGLSVLIEIYNKIPNHDYIYVGDQKNIPYGNKTEDEVVLLSCRIVDFLINKGCGLIVVACNTITTTAFSSLIKKYKSIIFVRIQPAIKPAAENSKTKKIGLLATKATIESQRVRELKNDFASSVIVYNSIGKGLVELVENQIEDKSEIKRILKPCLEPFFDKNIDQLVLGCTHYPFLIDSIKEILGNEVNIINPAPAIANRVKFILKENNKLKDSGSGSILFMTTGNVENMKKFTQKLFKNPDVSHIEI